MLRRSRTNYPLSRYRTVENREVRNGIERGKERSGFSSPYRIFLWRQNDLFRNVQEAQWEHLRRVYRRQWYEAYRVNADEYIYKYNQTKAAQLAAWEAEMEDQEKQRRDAMHMAEGRQRLRDKHHDILREYHERHFFHWYERASERLQYLNRTSFITRENIDAHLEAELDKYVAGKDGSYPLNFAGQMPFLEDNDGNIKEAPEHMAMEYEAHYPESEIARYTPPSSLLDRNEAFPISGEIVDVDADAVKAYDEMAMEKDKDAEEREATQADEASPTESETDRQHYINRGKLGGKHRMKKGRSAPLSAAASAEAVQMRQKAGPATTLSPAGEKRKKTLKGADAIAPGIKAATDLSDLAIAQEGVFSKVEQTEKVTNERSMNDVIDFQNQAEKVRKENPAWLKETAATARKLREEREQKKEEQKRSKKPRKDDEDE